MEALHVYGLEVTTETQTFPGKPEVVMQVKRKISHLQIVSMYYCGHLAIQTVDAEHAKKQPAPALPAVTSVARQIEALRVESDITQERVVELTGLSWRTVQRHEAGDTTPNKRQIFKYEQVYSKLLKRRIVISKLT